MSIVFLNLLDCLSHEQNRQAFLLTLEAKQALISMSNEYLLMLQFLIQSLRTGGLIETS